MQLALGAAMYNLRPSEYTPVEEVNILWALEGGLHIPVHNGVLFTHHRFPWRTFELVFSSSALRRIKAKIVTLEGLFRKLGPRGLYPASWLDPASSGGSLDIRSVVPHTDNNVYFSIPHPAGDPVTAADKERVLEFL